MQVWPRVHGACVLSHSKEAEEAEAAWDKIQLQRPGALLELEAETLANGAPWPDVSLPSLAAACVL